MKLKPNFITTRWLFIVSLIVITLTVLGVWLFGVGKHRTLYFNSILDITILSLAFFLFITIGLYQGFKLKDNLGKITDKIEKEGLPDFSGVTDLPEISVDGGEIVLGILSWILFTIVLLIFIWFFAPLVWAMILVFAAMMYWIFFRALRLVFKNSPKCRDDLGKSAAYGLGYTLLYNFWIYGIILATHYLT
jgi:hypothetical protein